MLEEDIGDIVVEWRRAYGIRPPPMTETHPHWPLISLDDRYRGVKVPESESLRDTAKRVRCQPRGCGGRIPTRCHRLTSTFVDLGGKPGLGDWAQYG